MSTTAAFYLPEGWTLRKVATALAREWLPALRAEPAARGARWTVQAVVEDPSPTGSPLWEPGISTREYQKRLDRSDLRWAIRATAGRGKHTILARLGMRQEHPAVFELTCYQTSLPEILFDPEKVNEMLQGRAGEGSEEAIFAALLSQHGFQPAP